MRPAPPTVGAVAKALFQLTRTSRGSLSEQLGMVARVASQSLGADSCSIMQLDAGGSYLFSKATFGLSRRESEVAFRLGEGVAGWVCEHERPAVISDATLDPRFTPLACQSVSIRAMVAVPLALPEGVFGAMTLSSPSRGAFGATHAELLELFGTAVGHSVETERLQRLALTDELTAAYNRQYLSRRLPEALAHAQRQGEPLSVAVLDVDHFKGINDRYGHAAGDHVLRELVRVARATLRGADEVIRYGGEEFLILMTRTPLSGAVDAAERLRRAIGSSPHMLPSGGPAITVSVGVTQAQTQPVAQTVDALIDRADALMYRAKREGRNRTVWA